MSIMPSIDFGPDFNNEMRDLAFRFTDFEEIPSDDLGYLYSKIPVSFIIEAMNETEKDGLVNYAFTNRDFLFKDFVVLIVKDYYLDHIVDLFYAENTFLRRYGITECDPMHDAGFTVSDFIDLNEYRRSSFSI